MASSLTQILGAVSAGLMPQTHQLVVSELQKVGAESSRIKQEFAKSASGRNDKTSRNLEQKEVVDQEQEQEKSSEFADKKSGRKSLAVA